MSDASFSARFYASVRDYLARIEALLKEGDLATAQKLGHKMLGLCQLFGTPEQVALCEELENARDLRHLQQTLCRFYTQIDNSGS
ncbi:Hpt domain-containing protein [Yersinia bercovieri]|uniref:Hpt domain-containing protein n=1 Tax=Yersinia bercovieri TaxID=634 RepID=UPI0011AB6572|nr:Hpt domain-containing protein [Yersinia bercovieri]